MTVTVVTLQRPFADRSGLNVISVSATAAENAYIDLGSLFRVGTTNLGIHLQAVGSAVVPSFTLADPEYARVAANDARVAWDVRTSQAVNVIQSYQFGATVLRLAFAGAGSVNICVI